MGTVGVIFHRHVAPTGIKAQWLFLLWLYTWNIVTWLLTIAGSVLKVNSVACLSFLYIKHQMQESLEVAPFMPIATNSNY